MSASDHKALLFLDIDGVLNSVQYAVRVDCGGGFVIDPDTIRHLQYIVDQTGCAIVISSTWRLGRRISDLRGILINAGMRHPCPVIGKTDVIPTPHSRGLEVKKWLDDRGIDCPYAILDDDSDFLPGQPLVKTDGQIGLTGEITDIVIATIRKQQVNT